MNIWLYNRLFGKTVEVETEGGTVELMEIKHIRGKRTFETLAPLERDGNWIPRQRVIDSHEVEFTNGHKKDYPNLESIPFKP